MHPNDSYYKTKRNLLIFVGALLLAVFAGLKLEGASVSDSLLPVKIEHPEWLRVILAVGVAFNVYQLSLLWAAQDSRVQENRFHRIDFLGAVFIAVAALLAMGAVEAWPDAKQLIISVDWSWARNNSGIINAVIGASFGVVTAAVASRVVIALATFLGSFIKGRSRGREELLKDTLIGSQWLLVYDPARKKTKPLSFKPDGSIGEGRNDNEHSWRVTNALLELLNSNGAVFSRFRYDDTHNRFTHTNDEDTLSLRSQTIEHVEPMY